MRISAKNQISIPKRIMKLLNLNQGDEVEFEVDGTSARLVPIKTIKIPRDQAWFWTPEWQEMELKADQDLKSGSYEDFEDLDQLMRDLHRAAHQRLSPYLQIQRTNPGVAQGRNPRHPQA
jgi:AbrB family looped-hinge helix DNA binding protein